MTDAHAVGDLDGLATRLEALGPRWPTSAPPAGPRRPRQNAEAKQAKEQYVVEAEKLAAGNDWRGGVNRFRELLDEWKALPRLDRATDDELWHRFSSARTTYTRRRKSQFAKESEQRETARKAKEKLVTEAEALQSSTDWGPTTSAYRDLMTRWKAAGSAPRGVDDELWKRFRGAQDVFFGAKPAPCPSRTASSGQRRRQAGLLVEEAEAILPVTRSGRGPRRVPLGAGALGRIGKVPREMHPPAGQPAPRRRVRHQGLRGRAVAADQPGSPGPGRGDRRQARGPDRDPGGEGRQGRGPGRRQAARDATASAATYREWLAQARKAADDFSG